MFCRPGCVTSPICFTFVMSIVTPRPGPLVVVGLAVLELEALGEVVDRTAAEVVLHHQRAGERREAVDERRGGDRSGEVRHDADGVRLADGRDLHHLGDAADVGQRRADVVDVVVLDELVEVPPVAPFLAVGEGDGRHLPQLRQVHEGVLVAHGILDEVGLVLLDPAARAQRVVEVEALVEVDAPVAVRADALAHFLALRDDAVDGLALVVDAADRQVGRAHAEGAIPGVHRRLRAVA